ncbi:MAG TPA: ATP-binding protein [Myxococcales bacterium]|nr:ATP-binding protein [Myxococcales bacterium]
MRARLTLWHALVLTVIVCSFSTAIFILVRAQLLADLDSHLERDLAALERTYRDDPGELFEAESRAGIRLFEVEEGSRLVYRTEEWTRRGVDRAAAESGTFSWKGADGQRLRVLASEHADHRIAVAADEGEMRKTLRSLALVLALGIPVAVALSVAGGSFLARRALKPIGNMADRARKITAESLDERLPVEDRADEFGRLATIFNETLSRLQGSFERLRRFTADASHELRTPLTAMRSVGEVALHESLDAAKYRDVIGSMLEEVERLTGLVENLLLLTRAESGRLTAAVTVVDVGSLATRAAETLRVLAEEKEQTLTIETEGMVNARCDPALLRQGIVNLVDNAIKYTPSRGAIHVGIKLLPTGDAAIEVKDSGPGIARAHQERIFERFYRVEAARSKSSGGMGLGLAITRWAVEANGGRIELESQEGRGSLFRVVLSPS